jgi:hypothetical protein
MMFLLLLTMTNVKQNIDLVEQVKSLADTIGYNELDQQETLAKELDEQVLLLGEEQVKAKCSDIRGLLETGFRLKRGS